MGIVEEKIQNKVTKNLDKFIEGLRPAIAKLVESAGITNGEQGVRIGKRIEDLLIKELKLEWMDKYIDACVKGK
jgi:hypothetical protein